MFKNEQTKEGGFLHRIPLVKKNANVYKKDDYFM